MTRAWSMVRAAVVLALAGCGTEATQPSHDSHDSQVVAGQPAAAQPNAGGAGALATPGAAAGAPSPAGSPAGAGSAGNSGRSNAGAIAVDPPKAGAPAAGGGGTAGAADGGMRDAGTPDSGAVASTPSAGCGKQTARPANGMVMQADRIYRFPASYDGKTPMPLLLGLHAAGNPVMQIPNLTKGSRLESDFVGAFPKSAGSAWVYNTDLAKVKAVLDDVLANYCVDTARIFATGHSSGAQMVVQLLCNGEKRFKAVAPVAASKYCAKVTPVPVLYIQGMMDAQRGGGNGMDVVNVFATSNGCGTMSVPKDDIASCMSSFDRQQVTPGCVTYQGCMQPTLWCSHNDNGYNNTDGRQHGWPCFANAAIASFFVGQE